jgi:hypothetical protein
MVRRRPVADALVVAGWIAGDAMLCLFSLWPPILTDPLSSLGAKSIRLVTRDPRACRLRRLRAGWDARYETNSGAEGDTLEARHVPGPDASRTNVASPAHSLNGWPTRYTTRPSAPEAWLSTRPEERRRPPKLHGHLDVPDPTGRRRSRARACSIVVRGCGGFSAVGRSKKPDRPRAQPRSAPRRSTPSSCRG